MYILILSSYSIKFYWVSSTCSHHYWYDNEISLWFLCFFMVKASNSFWIIRLTHWTSNSQVKLYFERCAIWKAKSGQRLLRFNSSDGMYIRKGRKFVTRAIRKQNHLLHRVRRTSMQHRCSATRPDHYLEQTKPNRDEKPIVYMYLKLYTFNYKNLTKR